MSDSGPSSDRTPLPDGVVHEYDGILEQDNRLPLWWLGTFYGAILFAACYWTTYEGFQTLPNPSAAYREEAAAVAAADAAKARAAGPMNEAVLEKLAADPASLDQGKSTFTTLCAACHAPTGAGTIGPNLTDAYWLHGGTGEAIYTTVRDGFAAKGMPAWGPQIGEEKVRTVAAYVRTLRNTNVAGGKAPQGDLEK